MPSVCKGEEKLRSNITGFSDGPDVKENKREEKAKQLFKFLIGVY